WQQNGTPIPGATTSTYTTAATQTSDNGSTFLAIVSNATGSVNSNLATLTVNGPDTTFPTVSISAPIAGATVSGLTTVSANAADNVGVVGVQFQLDGVNLNAEVTASPYSTSWDTVNSANGP